MPVPTPPGPIQPVQPGPGGLAPRGTVTAIPIPGLDVTVIRATNASDLQLILDLIEHLQEINKAAVPRLEVVPLEYQDCNVMADFLTMLFSRVIVAGPGGNYLAQPPGAGGIGGIGGFGGLGGLGQQQQNRGAYFLALPRFNAILVAVPESRFPDIMREIRRLDGPNDPGVFPKAFRLKNASAQIVAQQLQQFWNARYPGENLTKNQFTVTFNSGNNTVYVQASKADLEQVERLLKDWDTEEVAFDQRRPLLQAAERGRGRRGADHRQRIVA